MKFLIAFSLALFCGGLASAQGCHEIKFARGASSGEVGGFVSETESLCFTFGSGAGQTARVELFGSENACFVVDGIVDGSVDCIDDFTFTTQRRMYQVNVYQLFRSLGVEQFRLRLTIY